MVRYDDRLDIQKHLLRVAIFQREVEKDEYYPNIS